MIRLLVIAPVLAVRVGLRTLLGEVAAFEVIEEAATLADAGGVPPETDVIVLVANAAARPELEEALPDDPGQVAVLLVDDDPAAAQLLSGLPLRGWGLLPPDAAPQELAAAVQAVHEGLVVGAKELMEPLFARRLVVDPGEAEALLEPLTDREIQVLDLVAGGLANKQIAGELSISEHTVKFHVSSIYAKLGATNRAEAVRLGARQGLIVL